eukprot:TRINITY_DN445_c0_g1_i7.p1 TRINITY_DN445_c0_g1~~TRINITY_DN445_c0_g1_i7.p1  ORF type:complete len:170 (-),score=21.06 TRINITY_DN445_c0_g1_i7:85-594(-)
MTGYTVNTTVYNASDPAYFFDCQFLLDTGCLAAPIKIPYKKVKELHLPFRRAQIVKSGDRHDDNVGVFGPVYVVFRTVSGGSLSVAVDCISFVPSLELGFLLCPAALPSLKALPLKDDDETSKTKISISPVEYPPMKEDHDTCIMGPACWAALGLHIDTKKHELYFLSK